MRLARLRPLQPWTVFFLAMASCSADRISLRFPELTSEVAWGALVLEELAGTNVGTTGLVPIEDGRVELEVPGDVGANVVFYAYRDEDLAPEIPRDPNLLAGPLQDAAVPEAILPKPFLQARAELVDGASFVPDDAGRELTAPWIPPCATLGSSGPDPSVLVSCVGRNCVPTLRQDRCRLEIDLSGSCGLGVLEVKLLPENQAKATANLGSFEQCESVTARSGAELGLRCRNEDRSDCRIDLYPNASRVQLEVENVKLDPTAPEAFDGVYRMPSLALLDETELVTSLSGDQDCTPSGVHRLVFVDRSTMQITKTATTPYCFTLLTKDPLGPGFIGIARNPPVAVRFDRAGKPVMLRAIEDLRSAAPQTPLAWSVGTDQRSAAIWISSPSRTARETNDFVELRFEDLMVTHQASYAGDANYPVALTPTSFVLMDDEADMLRYFDRIGGTERLMVPLVTDSLTNRSFWSMMRLGDSERLLILMNSTRESVALVDEGRSVVRVVASELNQPPHTAASIPGRPGKLLLATGKDASEAELVVFDTEEVFFLPGRTTLGISDVPVSAVSDGLDEYVYLGFRSNTRLFRVRVVSTP